MQDHPASTTGQEHPAVSVVVAARNAAETLPRTLAALARQEHRGERELIVVDNASTDDTAAIAAAAGATVLRNERNLGVAASRNRGAAAATAPVLAFTDADCEPVAGWLAAGLAAIDRGADVVQGAVAPPPRAAVGPWDRMLHITAESGLFETASLFVRRSAFAAAGGFPQERPPGPGPWPGPDDAPFGEDARLGARLRATGARTAFAPDALVHHAVFPRSPSGFLAERLRLRHFPTLAREVPLGRFLSRRTAAFDAAVAGVAAAALTRRAAPLATALPYAWMARPQAGRGHPLGDAAVEVLADAVGMVALLYGSVAARRLLL